MEEFFPVFLVAALGIAIWLYAPGRLRWILSVLAVSGLAATTFTGEFEESWLYLLKTWRRPHAAWPSVSRSRTGSAAPWDRALQHVTPASARRK
jgi:hypothetical protein